MIEYNVLRSFCEDKQTYLKYSKSIPLSYLKTNFKELYKLYNIIKLLYTKHSFTVISPTDLEAGYIQSYPVLNEQDRIELTGLIQRIFTSPITASIPDLLASYHYRALAGQLAVLSIGVSEGKKDLTLLQDACRELLEEEVVGGDVEWVTDDLEALYAKTAGGPGIRWQMDCLNKSLGPLRKGNFGIVFARPEAGKTTFVSHFATHATTQVDKPVIWFNNEQAGEEVKLRFYQSMFGVSTQELFSDLSKYKDLYKQQSKGLLYLLDRDIIDVELIEKVCEQHDPSLVIIDQLDKIEGFEEDRHDLTLGQVYIWARKLAKRHCPVIGVTQASDSGENVKYLTRSHMADSRTSKPAEADWILGIGETQADDFKLYRYFNISKNKLIGDKDTDPSLRHGQFQVIIQPDIARYTEI